ncbi:glycosyltransferase family 2 protein [Sphingobacterium detergens]
MRVALLITTYNRPDALEAVLNSVEHQSLKPIQVIIADDGSDDRTFSVIQKYLHKGAIPILHSWHEDKGFRLAESRNRGLALVESDYVIMIDGDMILDKHFIEDHVANAQRGFFLQGGRCLLTPDFSEEILKNVALYPDFHYMRKGIESRFEKRLTAFRAPWLTKIWKKEIEYSHKAIRGCNMSFFMDDIIAVNGFNNDMIGWGREDSEFVERLFNSGIKRYNIKFSALGYHLYHVESSRESLPENDRILRNAMDNKLQYCSNGLNKFLKQ